MIHMVQSLEFVVLSLDCLVLYVYALVLLVGFSCQPMTFDPNKHHARIVNSPKLLVLASSQTKGLKDYYGESGVVLRD